MFGSAVRTIALGTCFVALPGEAARTPRLIDGAPDRHLAVVQILSSSGSCTGTYFGAGTVLTAAHCVPSGPSQPGAVLVAFVDNAQPSNDVVLAGHEVVRFADNADNATLDLALVYLDERHVPVGVAPIPRLPAHLALTSDDVGREVTLVGFGANQPPVAADARAGTRLTGASTLTRIDAEVATVTSGRGQARACFGDSGGPLLVTRAGVEYVAGVLSSGAADCSGVDHYERVDYGRGARFVDAPALTSAGCNSSGARGDGGNRVVMLLALLALALLASPSRRRAD